MIHPSLSCKVYLFTTPNILIFLVNDLGWHDVGYHGAEIRTPNIDRLANLALPRRRRPQRDYRRRRQGAQTGRGPHRGHRQMEATPPQRRSAPRRPDPRRLQGAPEVGGGCALNTVGSRSTWWRKSSQIGQISRGNQLHLHEVVESFLETAPGEPETASRRDVFGQIGIERA